MDGTLVLEDIGARLHSGCRNHASSGNLCCGSCCPQQPVAPIPQNAIKGELSPADYFAQEHAGMEYLVECVNPVGEGTFDVYLPRSEVLPQLLCQWESLPAPVRKSGVVVRLEAASSGTNVHPPNALPKQSNARRSVTRGRFVALAVRKYRDARRHARPPRKLRKRPHGKQPAASVCQKVG